MKKLAILILMYTAYTPCSALGQSNLTPEVMAKSDTDQEKKAAEWIASLHLGDTDKEERLKAVVATHLKAVRDWHNNHPFSTVPAGINPATGKLLSDLERQIIANSAMPKSVHESLMSGLRKDLSEEQVAMVLDK